jgi:NTE family protein
VLCLAPTAGYPVAAVRRTSAAVAATEAAAVRTRGAQVELVDPDERTIEAFGRNLMDARRRDRVAAAGYAQGRRLATASD